MIRTLAAIAPSVAQFLGSSCEVVVHDLRAPERSIVAIVNGHVTGRAVGGPLIGGPVGDLGVQWINELVSGEHATVYETMTKHGSRLKSTTRLFRDANQKPFAAFCINLNVETLTPAATWLQALVDTSPTNDGERTPPQPRDVDEILHDTIEDCFGRLRLTSRKRLSKDYRLAVIREMDRRGVFLIRGAVRLVAERMDVSKFTVYRYLDEVRGEA